MGSAPLPAGRPPIGGPFIPGGLASPGPPGPPGPPESSGCPGPLGFGGGLGFGLGFGFGGFLPPRLGSCGFPCGFLPWTARGPCSFGGLPHPGAPLGIPPLAGTPLLGAVLPCVPLFRAAPLPGAALTCAPLFGTPFAGATLCVAHPLPGLPLFTLLLLLLGCHLLGMNKS